MIGKYNKSVIVTYLGLCLSLVGMELVFMERMKYAMICMIFAGICDLFDGKIARMCKRDDEEKAFGIQIDSLVDVVSFLAFPAVVYLGLFKDKSGIMHFIILPYVLAGIIRLAWFNMHAHLEGKMTYYEGLPVTYMALILPVFYLIYQMTGGMFKIDLFAIIYLVVGLLYILPIPIKKPTGIWYGIFSLLAIGVTMGIIWWI